MTITVNPIITAVFDGVGPFCEAAVIPDLNLVSNNGITGTWSPEIDNTATTVYTFTPNPNQCANGTNLTITIDPNVTPEFAPVSDYCAGAVIAVLPTISENGINGNWTPVINNTTTTTYTFTPTAGQCATTSTTEIVINPVQVPVLAGFGPYCVNDIAEILPLVSENSLNGIWNPSAISTLTAGESEYVFTPSGLNCFSSNSVTVNVYDYPETDITISDSVIFSGQQSIIMVSGADTYDWFTIGIPLCEGCSTATFDAPATQAADETYEIILTSTSNGCAVVDTIRITVLGDIDLEIPEGFSPNADGIADSWEIKGLERLNNNEIVIHNRWGNIVYSASPYNNDWNGIAKNGEMLPAGTYYYVFKPDSSGSEAYAGYVYINY
jgi:gliding motility-associated-like protein